MSFVATTMLMAGGTRERSQLQATMIFRAHGILSTKESSSIGGFLMWTERSKTVRSCMTRGEGLNFLRQPKPRSEPQKKRLACRSYRYYGPCLPRLPTAAFVAPLGF